MILITKLVILGLVASFIKPGHLFKSPWEYVTESKPIDINVRLRRITQSNVCVSDTCNKYGIRNFHNEYFKIIYYLKMI